MLLALVLAVVALIGGCAHVARPIVREFSDIREVKLKNYEVGQRMVAFVGEPVVRIKEYFFLEDHSTLVVTNNFTISGGLMSAAVNVTGRIGDKYIIIGEVDVGAVKAKAIKIPGSRLVFGILADGHFSGVAASFNYGISPIKGVNVYNIDPETTQFLPAQVTQALEDQPFTNMEIIYSGMSEGTIHLLYREYSVKDLIRPAFSQELRYPTNSEFIRYRTFRIAIHEVTPERLDYTVLSQ